jgi:Cu-Zn family superoxide dismutase
MKREETAAVSGHLVLLGLVISGLAALPVAVSVVAAQSGAAVQTAGASAELKDPQGKTIGRAELTETPHGVLVRVALTGAAAGEHAVHVHETGRCDAPTFESAGGHFNPGKAQHGYMNPKGPHAGDLPNIHVPAGGQLEFQFIADGTALKSGRSSLLDGDGSALVVHASPDDYRTDPAGNAGDRIACGVVQKR